MVRNRDGSYSYLARSQDVPLDQVTAAGRESLIGDRRAWECLVPAPELY